MLREEATSPSEVQGLLASAAAFLADAKRDGNSDQTRYNIAYEAAHALALAAMRACGLRPAQGPGHRAMVFSVLDATTVAPPKVCIPLSKANEKRNRLTYDGLTTFSRAELEELIQCVQALDSIVREGISKGRSDLVKKG